VKSRGDTTYESKLCLWKPKAEIAILSIWWNITTFNFDFFTHQRLQRLIQSDWKLKREVTRTVAYTGIILHFSESFHSVNLYQDWNRCTFV
jgi:hypothetical protein